MERIIDQYSEQDTDKFTKSSFPSVSVMFYLFVGGDNNEVSVNTCEEIKILEHYMKSFFTAPNYVCIHIPPREGKGNEAYQTLIQIYGEKVKNRALTHLDSWGIVPIFLQSDYLLAALEEYNVLIQKLVKYADDNLVNYLHIPSILFEGNDAAKNEPLMKELLVQKNSWRPSLPFLLIYPSTHLDFIEYQSRLHTIFLTSMLQRTQNPIFDYRVADVAEQQCYASRLLTISKPYHIEILLRVKSLLEYFLKEPDDSEKRFCQLGTCLSSLPYETLWNYWRDIPLLNQSEAYRNLKISIRPAYSLIVSDSLGRDEVEELFNVFAEKYYYFFLSININDIDQSRIRDKFFDKYVHGYGYYIAGFTKLFNTGDANRFKDEMIEMIEVESFEDTQIPINDYLQELVEKMMNEIQCRTKNFYSVLLSDQCNWYQRAKENYKNISDALNNLSEVINSRIAYWRGIEGDMTLPQELWNDDNRKQLLNIYIQLLKSENTEIDFSKFIDVLFLIAKEKMTGNRVSYMEDFAYHSKDSTVVSSWKRLLAVPDYRIVPNGQSKTQNMVLYPVSEQMIKDLEKINGSIDRFLCEDSDVKDRIDYIVVSGVGTWDKTLEDGKSDTDT